MTDKSEEEHPYLYPTWPKPYLYPPYPIKGMSEVTDCEHKHAQFQGMYSLLGHYHCPVCKSRFCPQEFQKYREGVDMREPQMSPQPVRVINSVNDSIQWFCEDEIEIGDPLYGNYNNDPMIARSFKNREWGDKFLGVSTVFVVNIDLTKHPSHDTRSNVVNTGNKIRILQDGEIVIHRKYDKIPCGQPMYVSKKGKITWRKQHGRFEKLVTPAEHIGWASSKQDKDGSLKVRIKIND